mmetsp:Transcript_85626/g.239150  ORF Transcript_85626/g.239150 Transcript_85626/m.239150 type:complete len:583 (-) Transcript_85626:139-1887(-)
MQRPLAASHGNQAVTPPAPPHQRLSAEAMPHSGEMRLVEMLTTMDQHMQQLRETQQGLVNIVEVACRRALGHHFGRLVLVGSAALRVETPGSDVDVVCFTRRDGPKAAGMPVDILRSVYRALKEHISQYADSMSSFNMELIDDARVPILRVNLGPQGSPIAVDVSVDQSRPVDHVKWFQRVGAAPRPQAPPPPVAPLVTLTLRCAKWWLRQRQIPRTKEGALPTLAWLLMAVHVCSLKETHDQASISNQRPMAALLVSLTAFFRHYSAPGGLDGVLVFGADGSSSEFNRRAARRSSPWFELSVLDPTREGAERLDLAPRLHPATQLLFMYELRRASQRLEAVPRDGEASSGQSRRLLDEVFDPLPEGLNALPSYIANGGLGALFVYGEVCKGVANVELGIIDRALPRPGWQAPFLHRSDERSELRARLLDVEERTGRCYFRRKGAAVVIAPCHFVCQVSLEKDGRSFRMNTEGVTRFTSMKQYVAEFCVRSQQATVDTRLKVEALKTPAVATLTSPSRSRSPHEAAVPPQEEQQLQPEPQPQPEPQSQQEPQQQPQKQPLTQQPAEPEALPVGREQPIAAQS